MKWGVGCTHSLALLEVEIEPVLVVVQAASRTLDRARSRPRAPGLQVESEMERVWGVLGCFEDTGALTGIGRCDGIPNRDPHPPYRLPPPTP